MSDEQQTPEQPSSSYEELIERYNNLARSHFLGTPRARAARAAVKGSLGIPG
jgi:hypothetical protein